MSIAHMEAEANAFAMELLMPFDWIVRDCQGLDVSDERAIGKLAARYKVAPTVMAMRVGEVRRELDDRRQAALPDDKQPGTQSQSDGVNPKTNGGA